MLTADMSSTDAHLHYAADNKWHMVSCTVNLYNPSANFFYFKTIITNFGLQQMHLFNI